MLVLQLESTWHIHIHDTFPREHVSFEFRSLDTDTFDKKGIEVEITRVFVLAVILEMERV